MFAQGRRVDYGDLQEARELLGVSLLDFCWLMGAATITWSFSSPAKARTPINDPVTCLLARVYSVHPDFHILPPMPTPASVFKLIAGPYKDLTREDLEWHRFGLLCGATPFAAKRWREGGVPNPKPQRLLLLLSLAVTRGGKSALRTYLNLLEVEARARGFDDGLKGVFKARSWGKRGARQTSGPARGQARAGKRRSRERARRARR